MAETVKGLSDDYENEDEPCDNKSKYSKHGKQTDLMKLSGSVLSNINYKVAFMLFVISILLFSDIFIDAVIRPIDGAIEGECTTTKGTIIQLIFLVIAYIILDLVVKYDIM
jgi:hypothetical protein